MTIPELSQEFLLQALDATALLSIVNTRGEIVSVNRMFLETTGYGYDEIMGKKISILNSGLHEKEFFKKLWNTVLKGQTWKGEIRNRKKNGSFFWVNTTIIPIMGENNRPASFLTIRHDISEIKNKELALKSKEHYLDRVLNAFEEILIECDLNFCIKNIWPKYININHHQNASLFLLSETFPFLKTAGFMDFIRSAFNKGQLLIKEFSSEKQDYLVSVFSSRSENEFFINFRDITKNKGIERELNNKEFLFRQIFNLSPSLIFITDETGKKIDVSSNVLQMVGTTREEFLDGSFRMTHDESLAEANELYRQLFENQKPFYNFEFKAQKKNGTEWYGKGTSVPLFNSKNEFTGTISFVQDMSADVKMKKLLMNAEKIAKIGSWELDLETNELIWSNEIYNIFELDPNAFSPSYDAFLAMVHPDDRKTIDVAYRTSIANNTSYDITHRLITRSKTKYLREHCIHLYNKEGIPVKSIGTVQDVSEIHYYQKELESRNSELYRLLKKKVNDLNEPLKKTYYNNLIREVVKYKELFERTSNGIIVLEAAVQDTLFIIKDVNRRVEELERVKANDVIGKEMQVALPLLANELMEHVANCRLNNNVLKFEPIQYKSSGVSVYKEFRIYKLPSNEIVILYDDVTDKVNKQQLLESSIKEKELLLSEVHHRIKNNLQITIGLLEMKLNAGANKENFESVVNKVKTISIVHELLYQSNNFGFVNIASYIQNILFHLQGMYDSHSTSIDFDVCDYYIRFNAACNFGLLVNEILSNSFKHAFEGFDQQDKRISVKGYVDASDKSFTLEIKDNGVGNEQSNFERSLNGMGLDLIHGLASQLGFTIHCTTAVGYHYIITKIKA